MYYPEPPSYDPAYRAYYGPHYGSPYGPSPPGGIPYPFAQEPYAYTRRRPAEGGTTKLKQAVFVLVMLCLLCGMAYLLVRFVGFDSLAQLQGADRMVQAMDVGPAPKL